MYAIRSYYGTAYEALPKTFSHAKIEHLDRIIKKEQYIEDHLYRVERQDVIASLIKIIRYKVQCVQSFEDIRGNITKDLKTVLENLILGFPVPNIVRNNFV